MEVDNTCVRLPVERPVVSQLSCPGLESIDEEASELVMGANVVAREDVQPTQNHVAARTPRSTGQRRAA